MVARGDVAAAVDVGAPVRRVADMDAPAVVVEGDVVPEDVARLRRLDALTLVRVGGVALDERALAGRRLVADVDAAADVVVRDVVEQEVAEGLRLERDAGRLGVAGVVALDRVAARVLERDSALVAADLVALDEVVVGEVELDGIGVRQRPDVVDQLVTARRDDLEGGPAGLGDVVALDEVAGRLDADGLAARRRADDARRC